MKCVTAVLLKFFIQIKLHLNKENCENVMTVTKHMCQSYGLHTFANYLKRLPVVKFLALQSHLHFTTYEVSNPKMTI
jgi:hypothetical protein